MKNIRDILLKGVPLDVAVKHHVLAGNFFSYAQVKHLFEVNLKKFFTLEPYKAFSMGITIDDYFNDKWDIVCDIKSGTFSVKYFGKSIPVEPDFILEKRPLIARANLHSPDCHDECNEALIQLAEQVKLSESAGLANIPSKWSDWFTINRKDFDVFEFEFKDMQMYEIFYELDLDASKKGLSKEIEVTWNTCFGALEITFRGDTDKPHAEYLLRPTSRRGTTDELITYSEQLPK